MLPPRSFPKKEEGTQGGGDYEGDWTVEDSERDAHTTQKVRHGNGQAVPRGGGGGETMPPELQNRAKRYGGQKNNGRAGREIPCLGHPCGPVRSVFRKKRGEK